MTKRKRVTITVNENIYEQFEAHCRLTGKVPSRVIDILIENFIDKLN